MSCVCCCVVQVLFSEAAEEKIRLLAEDPNIKDEKKKAALLLQNTIDVINQVEKHAHIEPFCPEFKFYNVLNPNIYSTMQNCRFVVLLKL